MNKKPQSARERLNLLVMASREYEAQSDQIQMQLNLLSQSILTTQITGETIENLKNLQDKQEILLPLGNLAFIKAKLMDSLNVLINVGASVFLEKSIDDAKKQIDQRLENLTKTQMQLRQVMQQIMEKIQQIRSEIERIANQMQQQERPPLSS